MTNNKKIAKMTLMTIKIPCPVFGKCGGCLYQNLTDEDYRRKKKTFIKRAFTDYGITVQLQEIREVPLQTRRRASFEYGNGLVGYHAAKSHQIVEIVDCPILKPDIVAFLPTLKTWSQQLGRRGEFFILSTEWGLDIHIKSDDGKQPTFQKLEQLAQMAGDERVVRLTFNGEPIAQKTQLPFLPDAFLQPSAEGEKILTDLMMEETQNIHRAIDLFCGSGTFTRPMMQQGIKVIGYDCSDSVLLLGANGIQRDLFRSPLLPEEMEKSDLIVLDPPRAGAKAQVEQIAHTNTPKIVMISCSPKTAARDCKILIDAGWHLNKVTPVDQFKWSNHIELVCVLER